MTTRHFGAPVLRAEDPRFLTGRAEYVDDIHLPGMLEAAVLRSPHAHARLRAIDTRAARVLPGVHAILTHGDLGPFAQPSPLLIPHAALTVPRTQLPLARDEVRYVGEAVALVIAEDRYLAEDALDLISVDYDALPVVNDLDAAQRGVAFVHADVPDNVAAHFVQRVGDVEAAFAGAGHVFREQLRIDRGAAQPMETRGVIAQYDARNRQLTTWISTQAPISIRNGLARLFGLPEHAVRVIAPDVGGGFGTKIMLFYPEEVLIPLAAMRLGQPVKWVEDRREHFLSANQEREQYHDVEVAVDRQGRILGLRDRFLQDTGAYIPYGPMVALITSQQLPGPYKLGSYYSEFTTLYTNKVPVSPYRGAGRPHGCFVMERVISRIGRELDLDLQDVRRRNLIQPQDFPYDVGVVFQDGGPTRYDSGDYPRLLQIAEERIGLREFRAGQVKARLKGQYLGVGFGCYVEGTGIGPYEGAHVRVEPDGRVFVATGVTTQGQGHYTTFAQIAADALGVAVEDVLVVTGDTARFDWGVGTFASRAAVTAGNAVGLAARAVADKARRHAAQLLEAREEDLELADGRIFVRGVPQRGVTLAEVAVSTNPLRYAYAQEARRAVTVEGGRRGAALPEGSEPGLEATRFFSPAQSTFASGVHAAIVEVDAGTGMLRILKYVAAHDCGRLINPMIVEGQIHGGVAQGVGGAFYEKLAYDAEGQPLSASFMDYCIPTAMEVPSIETVHLETPSPHNPLGIKGAGEAGVIPVPALIAEAVDDALKPLNVRVTEMPLSPDKLGALIREARSRRP